MNVRYNTVGNGQRIVVRLAAKEAGYPCLQVWEKLENFEDMIPLTWELKQKELADEKKRAAEYDAELSLIDSWLESDIVKGDESGNTISNGEATLEIIRSRSGEAECGGFRLYADRKNHTVTGFVDWAQVQSMSDYNRAMYAARQVAWDIERTR